MNIHEYQAKELLSSFHVPIPQGQIAYTAEEATTAAKNLGGTSWVVKAQIHAGGRGKAGGVVVAKSIEEVKSHATRLLRKNLITQQTGPRGQEVKRVYIEQTCAIAEEYYLSFVLNRAQGRIAIVTSKAGGMNIEDVALESPDQVITLLIDPVLGVMPFHGRRAAFLLGLPGHNEKLVFQLTDLLSNIYQAFMDLDATLIEINPLVLTQAGELIALDAKMTFDDNALFRHPSVIELQDEDEEDPMELAADKEGLNYVRLDGTIGCMVNGAGLAMATMDLIKLHGAEPANFLDVGGGANRERVTAAFKLLVSDPNVEAILVNIFGGIMRCDIIAEGIVAAAKDVNLTLPMVVRLQGTNKELGMEILRKSGLAITVADDLEEAAKKVVHLALESR